MLALLYCIICGPLAAFITYCACRAHFTAQHRRVLSAERSKWLRLLAASLSTSAGYRMQLDANNRRIFKLQATINGFTNEANSAVSC